MTQGIRQCLLDDSIYCRGRRPLYRWNIICLKSAFPAAAAFKVLNQGLQGVHKPKVIKDPWPKLVGHIADHINGLIHQLPYDNSPISGLSIDIRKPLFK